MADQVSGHVRLVKRAKGDQFYVKYRLRSGRQIQKRLGPEWKERGRPPEGYFTRKTAEQALQAILTDARRGEVPDPEDRAGRRSATLARRGSATSSTTASGRRPRFGTTETRCAAP